MSETHQYFCLKVGQAAKTGERSTGHITYRVLTDADRQDLFLTLTGNEGGGWFSNEIVSLSRIEEVLDTVPDKSQPLPSKVLRPAFISKSVNNAGFLGALLRAEGLLLPAAGDTQLHVLSDDWSLWKSAMLEQEGVPYDPPVKGVAPLPSPEVTAPKKDKSAESRGKRKGNKKAAHVPQPDVDGIASTEANEDTNEAQGVDA